MSSSSISSIRLAVVWFGIAAAALGQNAGTVRGTATDPSAAVVPGVTVQVMGNGIARTAKSDGQGKYTITLPPGTYSLRADAKGFVTFISAAVTVTAGSPAVVDIPLQIATEAQQVSVVDEAAGQLSTEASANVGALVLKNSDLDALPDDPDDLQSDLEALAGPAAGPSGAQFFVDGFSGGQLPPKSSIREIRINSNPFSSEFDRPGFGRIEIFTKPGTDSYHGSLFLNYGDRIFDTRNPFLATEPGYNSKMIGANLSGPVNKKASFFLDFNRRQIDEDALINAQWVPPGSLTAVPYDGAFPTPNRFWLIAPRLDYQINATNTLVLRYTHIDSTNVGGVGGFSLPAEATNSAMKINNVQATETMIIGTRAVDESRFQYNIAHNNQNAEGNPNIPVVNVAGAFTDGGSPFVANYSDTKSYEFQNILTFTQGTHAIKVGGRARQTDLASQSTSDFNGAWTFTSLAAYLANEPSQFTESKGDPISSVRQFDLGLFVQDDWRLRPNLTVNTGLRYETQNNIRDHNDWAPRLAFAWAPGAGKTGSGKTVIRAGWGMFYDRFDENNTLQALRFNGTTQENYQLNASPLLLSYPNVPLQSSLAIVPQNIYQVDRSVRAPYLMQSAVSLERSLPARSSLSVNFVNSRGDHTLRTRDINAPLPGTGTLPYPANGPIYQYETSGIFKQTQLITNLSTRFSSRFTLQGYYALGFAHSNAQGLPMDQYNTSLDWGRAQFDVRNRAFIGGNIILKWGISAAPFITMSSGSPFNITTGGTYDGDGIFNARPSFATASSLPGNVKKTAYGTFDLVPQSGETIIPVNYGEGPAQYSVNLRISRTWSWGEKASPNGMPPGMGGPGGPGGGGPPPGMGGGGRGGPPGGGGGFGGGMGGPGGPMGMGGGQAGKKYSLTATVNARNIFNIVNLAPPQGVLTSPFFGESTALASGFGPFGGGGGAAGVRRIELQLRLSF
jgi:hypothetical protein